MWRLIKVDYEFHGFTAHWLKNQTIIAVKLTPIETQTMKSEIL